VALVTNFEDRIRDLAGIEIGADTNALEQFVSDGCYDVINKLERTDDFDSMEFVQASSSIESAGGTDLDNVRKLYFVQRNNVPCRQISHEQKYFADSADSLYEASIIDPIYYLFNNQVLILPACSASNPGFLYYLPDYTITNLGTGSGASSIDRFPKQYYEHLMLYAAYMALGKQLLNLIEDTTAVTDLSMETIGQMMNADKPDSGGDVWDYLRDEDSEMAQATMAAIQSATGITKTKYEWYKDRMMAIRSEYIGKFNFQGPAQGGKA
jgi:hypothetical protein